MIRKIAFCFLAVLLITAWVISPGSTFDSNDYGGGDSGGWDSGGDYDSGGGYGGEGVDINGDGEVTDADAYIIMLIVVFGFGGLFFVAYRRNKTSQAGTVRPSSNEGLHIQLPDRTEQIENIIKAHDTNFSANDFVSFVKRVYIDIQTAWCKRDLVPVRVFLHDNLYDATAKQVQAKIDQGVIYHYESMVVNTAYLTSYTKDEQFEYLTLYLNARMIDWQEDEKTGNILRGDKTTRWDLRYKMKFMRSIGVLTKEEVAGTTGHNCPNCGAPFEMTSSAKCEYCGSVITTGQYSWVLSDFGTVRNDTVDEGVKE